MSNQIHMGLDLTLEHFSTASCKNDVITYKITKFNLMIKLAWHHTLSVSQFVENSDQMSSDVRLLSDTGTIPSYTLFHVL